jgi:hypothetical protein
MTAIDRTAYPRPGSRLTYEELRARYTLSDTDLTFGGISPNRRKFRLPTISAASSGYGWDR